MALEMMTNAGQLSCDPMLCDTGMGQLRMMMVNVRMEERTSVVIEGDDDADAVNVVLHHCDRLSKDDCPS